ncbi:hypothetical protein BDZ94DRAFT_138374 [Collybia nuda]|uniref:NAD(P)-binding protein n=1 Tax=Collybia nuda TaxID=64659 RepID=A0A9P5YDD6_9AGAR|nr:hypothetical protein BDZ94DRAFT_138374 [Collybia nuda]
MSLLVLSRSDVEQVTSQFTLTELQILMARVFSSISSPLSSPPTHFTPHRTSIPLSNHTTLFMPARTTDKSLVGTTVKVVSVPQKSGDTGGIPGSTLVLDEASGAAKAIVNSRGLTALRNAAGSLLSTNLVRLQKPKSMVVFGAGKQIEAHLDLHIRFFSAIKSCTIVNRTYNSRVESLQRLMELRFPTVQFQFIASSPEGGARSSQEKIKEALLSTTLIICATSSTSPLFPSAWVRTGSHVILIGSFTPSMHEVDGDLIRRAIQHPGSNTGTRQILLVDSREACAVEAGELIAARISDRQITEIGELVTVSESGELKFDLFPGSESLASESTYEGSTDLAEHDETVLGPITLFKSVGVGLQDVAIACAAVAKAEELAIGTRIVDYDS